MERTLFTIALWAASAGATLLAPSPALGIHERTTPASSAVFTVATESPPADTPASRTLFLVGAAVLIFVAVRRID